jgi:hypothetical protein
VDGFGRSGLLGGGGRRNGLSWAAVARNTNCGPVVISGGEGFYSGVGEKNRVKGRNQGDFR